jgi:hypothetical protein
MECVICSNKATRHVYVSYSRHGLEGVERASGKIYTCEQHLKMVKEMSGAEWKLFMRPEAPPASAGSGAIEPVKAREETSGQTEIPFEAIEPQSNGHGNGVT